MTQKIPLSSITVSDRQRLDLGDIANLASSIKSYGLIQPVVIDQNNRLVAGGRRLAACTSLGWTEVPVVYKETLSQDHLHEMEIEENVKRKDLSWQERVLAIETIHKLKQKRGALEGFSWGQHETGELLGINSGSSINYSLKIAEKLRKEQLLPDEERSYWKCDSLSDAWRLRIREEQDILLAELARRQSQAASGMAIAAPGMALGGIAEPSMAGELSQGISIASNLRNTTYNQLSKDEAKERYLSNTLNNPEKFEEYWLYRRELEKERHKIYLSTRLFHTDCIKFMQENEGRFDHIITDPPYGIDMGMLNQQNPHGQMSDIDTVLTEHEVEPNKELLARFFPAAFSTLKENGFCVTWCDQMLWQYMYDLAVKAGFKVQRWPITWVKLHHCMNQSAQYNFTKSTEIAMVCRKGNITLMNPAPQCHILAEHDEYKDTLGHPFVKPYDVWHFILQYISIEGQSILEPFAGRGSGVISILRDARNVIACESNEQHYNALVHNIQSYYLSINPNFTFV